MGMNIFQRLRQHFASYVKGTIEERPTPDGVECGDVGLMSPVEAAIARLKQSLAEAKPIVLPPRYFGMQLPAASSTDSAPSADEILEGAELLQRFGMDCFEAAEAIERMQMEAEVQDEMNRMRSQHERHRRMFHNALSFEPQSVRSQRPKIKPIPKLCQGCQWLGEDFRGDFAASAERLLCAVQPTGPDSEGNCSEFDALPVAKQPTTDWMGILDDCEEACDER